MPKYELTAGNVRVRKSSLGMLVPLLLGRPSIQKLLGRFAIEPILSDLRTLDPIPFICRLVIALRVNVIRSRDLPLRGTGRRRHVTLLRARVRSPNGLGLRGRGLYALGLLDGSEALIQARERGEREVLRLR